MKYFWIFLFIYLTLPFRVFAAEQSMIGYMVVPPAVRTPTSRNPTYLTEIIDAADEKYAMIIQAPKTGTISKVGWRTSTVTTGATLDIRLETVSATDGNPTGTLLGTNSNGSQVVADADDNTWFLTSLTTGVSVTKGDIFAVVIVNPSVSPGNIQISKQDITAVYQRGQFPYESLYTTSWTKNDASFVLALEYSDGSYAPIIGAYPANAQGILTLSSSTTPDEIGLKFKLPFPFRLTGFVIWNDPNGNITYKLYDSDGSTVLDSLAMDKDQNENQQNTSHYFYFDSTHSLSKDTYYRLTMVPDDTTSNSLSEFSVNAATIMDSFGGGQNFHKTERTDAGAWTDTTTDRPHIYLLIDAFDDGVATAGGGSGARFMIQ